MLDISKESAAYEGAKAALVLARSHETSEDILIRSSEYEYPEHAVRAALKATEHYAINYRTVEVNDKWTKEMHMDMDTYMPNS